jgi:transposase InsO family protein
MKLVFKSGKDMLIADTLSRAYLPARGPAVDFVEEIAALTTVEAETVANLYLVTSSHTLEFLTKAAEADSEYQMLIKQLHNGWPDNTNDLHPSLRQYTTFSDELSVVRGFIYKGDRLLVPTSARSAMLDRIHNSHIGVQGCIRRGCESIFWPGMTTEIRRRAESCNICRQYTDNQQKEPLRSHTTPTRPWQKVGVDIFHFDQYDYLLTVDYLSGFFEIDRLPSKAVSDIIYRLKQHFARYGLPDTVMSDNSPFNCTEFRLFARSYEFTHVTSSPRYPQSNGKVENAIRTVKRLMLKAKEDNSDPFLALLDWRNTPSEQLDNSPAQILLGRRVRTLLPMKSTLLDTMLSQSASEALQHAKLRQARYYNRQARERPTFSQGQTVRFKFSDDDDGWRKGVISAVLPNRSYNIKAEDGSQYRRTSRHIRQTAELPLIVDDDPMGSLMHDLEIHSPSSQDVTGQNDVSRSVTADLPTPMVKTSRYGRVIRKPA